MNGVRHTKHIRHYKSYDNAFIRLSLEDVSVCGYPGIHMKGSTWYRSQYVPFRKKACVAVYDDIRKSWYLFEE